MRKDGRKKKSERERERERERVSKESVSEIRLTHALNDREKNSRKDRIKRERSRKILGTGDERLRKSCGWSKMC